MKTRAKYRGQEVDIFGVSELELRAASRQGELIDLGPKGTRLIYRDIAGRKKHFAYERRLSSIGGYSQESEEHMDVKRFLALVLPEFNNQGRMRNLRLEERTESTKPDVLADFYDVQIGIEVQKSPMDHFDFEEKYKRNAAQGIYTLYIFCDKSLKPYSGQLTESLAERVFSITNVQKKSHDINRGRLYFFSVGSAEQDLKKKVKIFSVHLDSIMNPKTGYYLRNLRTLGNSVPLENFRVNYGKRANNYMKPGENPDYLLAWFKHDRKG